jgi:hypothetical protein
MGDIPKKSHLKFQCFLLFKGKCFAKKNIVQNIFVNLNYKKIIEKNNCIFFAKSMMPWKSR